QAPELLISLALYVPKSSEVWPGRSVLTKKAANSVIAMDNVRAEVIESMSTTIGNVCFSAGNQEDFGVGRNPLNNGADWKIERLAKKKRMLIAVLVLVEPQQRFGFTVW